MTDLTELKELDSLSEEEKKYALQILRELSQNEVHLKETIDSDKHLFTNGDKDIIVDTTASYHKSFAIDDDVAKDEMKGIEKETDLAID